MATKDLKVLDEIVIDFSVKKVVNVRCVKEDMKSRIIKITITKDGKIYNVDKDSTLVKYKIHKPDSTFIYNDATINDDGTIQIELSLQATAIEGICLVELQLIQQQDTALGLEGSVITTLPFNIIVEKSVVDDEDLRSTSESQVLVDLIVKEKEHIKDLEKIEGDLQGAEDLRKQNEEKRKTNEEERIANEEERKENEDERISNENTRQSKEKERETEEANRVISEKERETNEGTRVSNENIRVIAENERVTNEQTRQSNEATRDSAESIRKENELKRQTNEISREEAESTRATNEVNRISNEEKRQSDENKRADNEIVRKNNETQRQKNDASREQAEEVRNTNEQSRINNENTRQTNENAREASEKIRSTNEENRLDNESTRQINEQDRKTAESEREKNENLRISKEVAREENETERQDSENKRNTKEVEREQAENTREENESIRQSNENERQTQEQARTKAETKRESTAEELFKKMQETLDENNIVYKSEKGTANGVAMLDENALIYASQLPSYVDDVIEGVMSEDKASFIETGKTNPCTPESGKVYIDTNTNIAYRWGGNLYVPIGSDLALGTTHSTAFYGDLGQKAYDHSISEHARVDATKVEKSGTNGNIKIDGEEVNVYIHPSGTNPHGTTLKDLGIPKVENKSSEDIRSEITKENIVEALGYTPSETDGSVNDASKADPMLTNLFSKANTFAISTSADDTVYSAGSRGGKRSNANKVLIFNAIGRASKYDNMYLICGKTKDDVTLTNTTEYGNTVVSTITTPKGNTLYYGRNGGTWNHNVGTKVTIGGITVWLNPVPVFTNTDTGYKTADRGYMHKYILDLCDMILFNSETDYWGDKGAGFYPKNGVGNLSDLKTTDKSTVVGSINEIVNNSSNYYNDADYNTDTNKLQLKHGSIVLKEIEISGGGGGTRISPKATISPAIRNGNAKVTISWGDPSDVILDEITLSSWAGTKLVMKESGYPENENDGTVLLDNKTRDKYKTSGYTVSNLTNGKTYYFALFPYSTDKIYNYQESNRLLGKPSLVKLNSCTNMTIATAMSNVTVKWSDPDATKTVDGNTATWSKTILIYKQGSVAPTSITDGTIAVTETTRNQYSSNGYTVSGLTNGKQYTFALFAVSTENVTSDAISKSASLWATLTVTTSETSLYGKKVAATYGSNSVNGTFSSSGSVTLQIPWIGETSISSTDGTDTATSKITITAYEKTYSIELSFLKIVTFANGTDDEIKAMIDAHYNNKINISDYWAVGDTRNVSLSAMSATGVGESHRAQTVQYVIGDFDHDDLTTAINSHTKAAVTLLQKDCLMDATSAGNSNNGSSDTEKGYMNSTNTNAGGWKSCARRTWCNNVYFKALPTAWQNMVKTVNKKASAGNQSSTIEIVQDKIFLAAEIEVFGSMSYSFAGEGTQYQYYKNATANRYKMPRYNSSYVSQYWWERSPRSGSATYFCRVYVSGYAGYDLASDLRGLAPCLCI